MHQPTNKNKNNVHYAGVLLASFIIFVAGFLVFPYVIVNAQEDGTVEAENIAELNQELDEKREYLEDLQKKAELYEENVKVKQQESVTLNNQLSLLDLQVEQTENDIESITTEVDTLEIELEQLGTEIAEKTVEVESSEKVLAEFLRLIHRYDQQTYLEIFMTNTSFSDFFDTLRYTEDLQGNVEEALVVTKAARDELTEQEEEKSTKKEELSSLSKKLTATIGDLANQKDYKTILLDETKEDEATYQALLEEAKREQQAAQAEIGSLEQRARSQLEEEGIDLNVTSSLMWPVAPLRGISAYFYDPTYPFRYLFEHPAIDIPSPQGTPIRAADNGYVVRAKNAGLGYSYIMLVHNEELTSVYGHVSRIDVAEDDFVIRGQQIGLVGGLPGTPGAGRLSTGSHLHFEVRSGGIPVNPLDYLPAY